MYKTSGLAAIALGSNLGDSLATLNSAIDSLQNTPGIKIQATSNWYKTRAVGPIQPDYFNGCAILQVEMIPELLLEILLKIEKDFGRVRREKWGARTLDLDLLLYDDQIIHTPNLEIPHPRMSDRAFVLVPLAEIASDWIEPISGLSILQLSQKIDTSGMLGVNS